MTTTVDAGLYMRLSVEDETNNESTSIQTQRAMLTDHCRERGYRIVDCYVDDGQTGTNFERPEFQRMLRDIEAGKINTVICKDLSRFGRNYYEAGMYLDKYFVERNIRFIAMLFCVSWASVPLWRTRRLEPLQPSPWRLRSGGRRYLRWWWRWHGPARWLL